MINQSHTTMKPKFDYAVKTVALNGSKITYWDEGKGDVILLVHGIGCSKEYWAWLCPHWTAHYRVVAIDLPGYGTSDVPSRAITNLDDAAFIVGQIIESLSIKNPIIIGHSLGSAVVTQYALANPEAYQGLVLLSAAGFGTEIDWISKVLTLPRLGELFFRPTRTLIHNFLKGNFPIDGLDSLVEITYRFFHRPGVLKWHLGLMRSGVDLRGQKTIFADMDLARLHTPTLLIHGAQDPLFPVAHAERAARLIADAHIETLSEVKHNPHVERPDLVAQCVDTFIHQHSLTKQIHQER